MPKKHPLPIWKKLLLSVFGAVIFVFIILAFLFLYQGSTKPILKVADQFKPDPSWKLVGEHVEPPRIVCLGDVRCPSVYRSWNTGDLITREKLEQLITESHLLLHFDGDCTRSPNISGTLSICTASGVLGDMSVEISIYANDYAKKDNKVILSVN